MEAQSPGSGYGGVERPDPSRLRISDDDRHKVAEVLRQAAGDGRIDLDELDQRLEATYHAKTYGELVPITVDLPVAGLAHPLPAPRPAPVPPAGATVRYDNSLAIMSSTRRVGPWVVENQHSAFALMGNVVLDLREAQFASPEITVNASAIMGEVSVIVNAGTSVLVEGWGVMGEYTEQRPKVPFDPEQGGPTLRLRGLALMGSVSVQRMGPSRPSIRKRLGRGGP
jgi:hypothetical protein